MPWSSATDQILYRTRALCTVLRFFGLDALDARCDKLCFNISYRTLSVAEHRLTGSENARDGNNFAESRLHSVQAIPLVALVNINLTPPRHRVRQCVRPKQTSELYWTCWGRRPCRNVIQSHQLDWSNPIGQKELAPTCSLSLGSSKFIKEVNPGSWWKHFGLSHLKVRFDVPYPKIRRRCYVGLTTTTGAPQRHRGLPT